MAINAKENVVNHIEIDP